MGDEVRWCATAWACGIAEPATRAWIRRGDEREQRWVGDRAAGPGDGHPSGFEGLPQSLQDVGLKLCELIEEQDAVVRARDLPGGRVPGPATDEAGHRDAVVRGAERTRPVDRTPRQEVAQQTPDLRHIESLGQLERRQDAWEAAPEHGLAGAGWAAEGQAVSARGCR